MKNRKNTLARIIADNDQDQMEARNWLRQIGDRGVLEVWDRLQVVHSDWVDESITRLAALKLAELVTEWAAEKEAP